MKRLWVAMFVGLVCLGNVAEVHAETIRVKGKGLVCDYCARAMEKVIRKRPEVADLRINLTSKIVEIELKEGQALDDATIQTLVSESGYTIDTIERVPS